MIVRCNIHGVTSCSFSYDAERGFIEMGRSRSAGKRLTCMTRLAILFDRRDAGKTLKNPKRIVPHNSDADVRVMEPSLAPRGVFDGTSRAAELREKVISGKPAPITGFRNMESVCFSRKRGERMAGLGRCFWRQKSASRFRTGLTS